MGTFLDLVSDVRRLGGASLALVGAAEKEVGAAATLKGRLGGGRLENPRGGDQTRFQLSTENWATTISLSQKMKLKQGCGHMTGGGV